jgi:regulator of protease activity HflC (stomatin/prohibitin superfamily)
MLWSAAILLVTLALCVVLNIRIVKEDERLVVFRLGRFHRVAAPGLNLVQWGVETGRRVDLKAVLPDWRSLSDQELAGKLEHLARTGQLPPTA